MLSKAKIKFIKSLQIKKYRKQEQCFVVQGAKSVLELLTSDFETLTIVGSPDFLNTISQVSVERIEATEKELQQIGDFQTNDAGLAIARIKPNVPIDTNTREFVLALDDIRDPGNLGTIIRTADWYGIIKIIASLETADLYNPKVISASMGSFTRVQVYYSNLKDFLLTWKGRVYGAYLDGLDVHEEKFGHGGLILIGNESRGISANLEKFVSHKITIPRYGRAESLNAAIATAVICDNIRSKSKDQRSKIKGQRGEL